MTAFEIRDLWLEHIEDCVKCQSNNFTRCALGDGLLAQMVKADPVRWCNLDEQSGAAMRPDSVREAVI